MPVYYMVLVLKIPKKWSVLAEAGNEISFIYPH